MDRSDHDARERSRSGGPATIDRPSLAAGLEEDPAPQRARSGGTRRWRRAMRPAVAIALTAAAVISAWRLLGGSGPDLASASRTRTLIDAVSGEVFVDHRVPDGASFPLPHPGTGEATLYPAEACHWTAEGEAKWTPTWVHIPLDQASAACPDCGRKVVPHNPRPPEDKMLQALQRHRDGN